VSNLRRFRVGDAVTFTAATAVGLAATRHVWKYCGYAWFWNLDDGWTPAATLRRLSTAFAVALPGLAAWTAAVLAARLAPPRPPVRRIALQPGSVACGLALMVVIAETIGAAASLAYFENSKGYLGAKWRGSGVTSWLHTNVLVTAPYTISFAVLAGWAVLLLSRRARPEPSWIDRLGRALGVCWIVVALVFWFTHRFLNGSLPGALSR
jgi:hypothetical protein